jgi:aldehyde dehydrogenase
MTRSNLLRRIADVMEKNLETLARAEAWDKGTSIHETMVTDLPHLRCFS